MTTSEPKEIRRDPGLCANRWYPNRASGRGIALRDVCPLYRWRSVAARLGAIEQVPEVVLQVLRIRGSRLSVYARRAILPVIAAATISPSFAYSPVRSPSSPSPDVTPSP